MRVVPTVAKQVKSASLEAARSSPRGGGGAPSGWASLWEYHAAQSRQARPEEPQEPQEPSWGAAKGVTLTVLVPPMRPAAVPFCTATVKPKPTTSGTHRPVPALETKMLGIVVACLPMSVASQQQQPRAVCIHPVCIHAVHQWSSGRPQCTVPSYMLLAVPGRAGRCT